MGLSLNWPIRGLLSASHNVSSFSILPLLPVFLSTFLPPLSAFSVGLAHNCHCPFSSPFSSHPPSLSPPPPVAVVLHRGQLLGVRGKWEAPSCCCDLPFLARSNHHVPCWLKLPVSLSLDTRFVLFFHELKVNKSILCAMILLFTVDQSSAFTHWLLCMLSSWFITSLSKCLYQIHCMQEKIL